VSSRCISYEEFRRVTESLLLTTSGPMPWCISGNYLGFFRNKRNQIVEGVSRTLHG
jgi:hypothetical protein